MGEMIDKVVMKQGASSATPPAKAGETDGASNPAPAGGHPPKDARIDQLTREKSRLMAEKEELARQFGEIREQVAELRGRVGSQPTPPKAIRGWGDIPDDNLHEAFQTAMKDQNPPAAWNAVEEYVNRRLSKAQQEILQKGKGELESEQYKRQVEARIAKEFGPEANDRNSELFERASQYAGNFRQRYGDDWIDKAPDLAYQAYLMAKTDLTASMAEELQSLRAENQRFKEMQQMEPGAIPGVSRPSEEVKAALEKGDVRGAIANLRFAQRFRR